MKNLEQENRRLDSNSKEPLELLKTSFEHCECLLMVIKDSLLSNGIIDDSREWRFSSKLNFRGRLPSHGGTIMLCEQDSLQKCMETDTKIKFHALIAFSTVCTIHSGIPLLLGL